MWRLIQALSGSSAMSSLLPWLGLGLWVSLAGCAIAVWRTSAIRQPRNAWTVMRSKFGIRSRKAESHPSLTGNCEPIGPLPDEALESLFGPILTHRSGFEAHRMKGHVQP